MKRALTAGVLVAVLAMTMLQAGCGTDQAREYAEEARSSYISAKAVLAGLQEFPLEMEEMLRSGDLNGIAEQAEESIEYSRELVNSANAAFQDCREKCELIKQEGYEDFIAYADMLLQLVDLNQQVINAYSEFMGLSSSLLENLPYQDDPGLLMPTLTYLDETTSRINELMEQIRQLEEETEEYYRTLIE
jgi:polyhydroxyalkanoate synthesis regulator phasin